ncbi:FAD-binding domain-containing protein [Lojkania enalia]|uniref:D-arabinono-1,4-lactone oxidase n=1 Tax=Lojkania enalia TaxID=147567 RepID=A0A9P4N0C8_9PLEO|nr:FAD-binding domain-containing protein [Didymosphaeria enalia]
MSSSNVPSTNTWSNCIGQQTCHPKYLLYPTSLQDLIDAIRLGRKENLKVRAVGSGHSFSDVAPTDDILLDPHGMNQVLKVDASLLRDPLKESSLFAVQSGITIRELNLALDKAGKALINIGAYDGQTLAGAISTGTHGKGITLGPMASSVRSLVVVSETGDVYQYEPSNGITDQDKFATDAAKAGMTLKQDDDFFQSVVVCMGCMGLIYSYIIEVVPTYFLIENRTVSSWENVKTELAMTKGGLLPEVLTYNRHYEVDINPYAIKGVHHCIVQTTNEVKTTHASGSRGFKNWLAGLLASWPVAEDVLVDILNEFPKASPWIVGNALSTLVDVNYIDKSYVVLNIGKVNNIKGLAMELSFPVDENLVNSIDNLFAIFADEASAKRWYLAGPIALRFVAPSQAYLAPQEGRPTCMVELDMIYGVMTGGDLLKSVTQRVISGNPAVRVHWGLDLDTVTGRQVQMRYGKYSKWLAVYRQLNSTGMFNSVFTDRLGISVDPNSNTAKLT